MQVQLRGELSLEKKQLSFVFSGRRRCLVILWLHGVFVLISVQACLWGGLVFVLFVITEPSSDDIMGSCLYKTGKHRGLACSN